MKSSGWAQHWPPPTSALEISDAALRTLWCPMKNWQFWMLFCGIVAVYLAVVNH
jgi:hypothetical protein